MRIVLLGAPGSGKGTQAELLRQALSLPHISTGVLLREAVRAGTAHGRRAEALMNCGELVPDDLILELLAERLAAADAQRGFILDGYPRNLAQAEALDAMLARRGTPVEHALQIDVTDRQIVERLAHRAAVEGRSDDDPEVVRKRLEVYAAQTAPVIEYYSRQHKLQRIDGRGDIDDIQRRITEALSAGQRC